MRRAVNTTCQGSAADVVKGAMVMLAAQLRATGLGKHCRMLLQVGHADALLLAWWSSLTCTVWCVLQLLNQCTPFH
jgi:DNA polymerase I-like protein with 3'-5' exonuclease and polymerase domains